MRPLVCGAESVAATDVVPVVVLFLVPFALTREVEARCAEWKATLERGLSDAAGERV